jgi:hypothetical protein
VVNLVIALVSAAIVLTQFPEAHLWTRPLVHSNHLLRSLVWVNLGLGLFNLLPAYPMDGGRVLRALFSRHTDMVQATRRAVSIAHALATLMVVVGMLLLFQGGHPDSSWLVMLGFFLLIGAQFEERSAIFQSVLETVHLEDVMLTDFQTLSPADTLEDALDKAVHTLQDDFPVVRGVARVGFSQAEFPQSQHYSCRGRSAPGRDHHFAEPDALHGVAGGKSQASQGSFGILSHAAAAGVTARRTGEKPVRNLLGRVRNCLPIPQNNRIAFACSTAATFRSTFNTSSGTRPSTCTTATALRGSPFLSVPPLL